jgi:F-type H+-transporting ATPase subunit gamma
MKSTADIKKRIRSVSNTQQITKAMEVVSATKMRRAQELALSARPYAFSAFELLANLNKKTTEKNPKLPKLFLKNKAKNTLLVVIASDKSLAGSLNSNALKKALTFYKNWQEKNNSNKNKIDVAVVGKKAKEFFTHRNIEIKRQFFGAGDFADFQEVKELSEYLKTEFLEEVYAEIVVIYTNFLSTLKQEPVIRKILPFSQKTLKQMSEGLRPKTGKFSEEKQLSISLENYLFEPSRQEVLNQLSERLFQMTVYHIILEANASEHSARMVAMKTASENAEEIVDDLTLVFNKRRQAKITQEIVEITSGSDSISR